MRGGRNKFGPMYKRDRALKQQAVRQRQQMLAQMQCQMQIMPGMANMDGMGGMTDPPDIKPNINMLAIMPPNTSASNVHGPMGPNMMGNPHMRHHHMLPMGSPNAQDTNAGNPSGIPPVSGQSSHQGPSFTPHPHMYPSAIMPPLSVGNNGQHVNNNSVVNSVNNSGMPGTMPGMMPEMPGMTPQEPHLPGSSDMLPMNQMMPTAPSPPVIPQLIRDLQENEPNQAEIQQKLSSISEMMLQQHQSMAAQSSMMGQNGQMIGNGEQTELPKGMIQLLCKLCDQALFLLVEWARGAYFFKELKVSAN